MVLKKHVFFFCLLLLGKGVCQAESSDRSGNNYYSFDTFILPMTVYSSTQSAMQAYDELNKIKTNFSASLPQNLPQMPNLATMAALPGITPSGVLSPVNQADFQDYLQKLERNNDKLENNILLNSESNLAVSNQMPSEQTPVISDFSAKEDK